jgi:pyruvate/2-oxoglutarate dehydrogenase complex dihydrolipoamide dehydrogenase (E3) component/uncharacterized protein (DUF2252 family)
MLDVIVIGAGPAGVLAALRAADLGARTALITRDEFGGMAANDGPVPVRTLAHVARLIREARQLSLYGIAVSEPSLDYARLLARVREVVSDVRKHSALRGEIDSLGATVYEQTGSARFVDPHTIETESKLRLQAEKIIICTGGASRRLSVPGFELTSTHSDAWGLTSVPPSMLVIGGGATGAQVASIFNAFGSRVQLFQAGPRILPTEDEDVSVAVANAFRGSGIVVREDFGEIESFEKTPSGVRMIFSKDGARDSAEAALAVVAVGWLANSAGLSLATAGVETDHRGFVRVDAYLRTSAPHIFAAGDITGRLMLVPQAIQGGVARELQLRISVNAYMTNHQMNCDDTTGRSREDRLAQGKQLRQGAPRPAHGLWKPADDRPDPVAMLIESGRGRLESLAPIRYARMLTSPFAFFRGSAMAMAFDLASTPVSGLRVQLCGDCHLGNFGGFATPERRLIFDMMDFDETIPGPWEWDIKRLGASFHLAGRANGLSEANCEEAALTVGRAYRRRLSEFARMKTMDVFYASIDANALITQARDARTRKRREQLVAKARKRTSEHFFARSVGLVDGRRRITDEPPFLFHPPQTDPFEADFRAAFETYKKLLPDHLRFLLQRFDVVDVAMKVAGVGSVGTRCGIILLMAGDEDPLILQIKEAGRSALEPFVGRSRYKNMGQRVVAGQRMLQSVSDSFLGWGAEAGGRHYYIRQLRDMKKGPEIESFWAQRLIDAADVCGWTLARAHARSGDAALISGYLGKSDVFELALAAFSRAYADQSEQDYQVMCAAVKSGKLAVNETVFD